MTEAKLGFRDLKVGDRVDRWLGNSFWMEMEVIKVDDDFIYCDSLQNGKRVGFSPSTGWKFHRDVGCEEDPDLQWGKNFGKTGSYLKLKETPNG